MLFVVGYIHPTLRIHEKQKLAATFFSSLLLLLDAITRRNLRAHYINCYYKHPICRLNAIFLMCNKVYTHSASDERNQIWFSVFNPLTGEENDCCVVHAMGWMPLNAIKCWKLLDTYLNMGQSIGMLNRILKRFFFPMRSCNGDVELLCESVV